MSFKNFFEKHSKTQIKKAGKVTTFICGVLGIIIGYWGGINAIPVVGTLGSLALLIGMIVMYYMRGKNTACLIVDTLLHVVIVTVSVAATTALLVNFGLNVKTVFAIIIATFFIFMSWLSWVDYLHHVQTKG